jgi:SAM-dependent methyltransferase
MLPTPTERWANPALIDHLARVRKSWDTLTRRIVRAVLMKWLPASVTNVVEIGAGGGQLREWLPAEVAAVTTHTEPSEPFLKVLRARHPDAKAVRAEATALPFPAGSVDAVLALCVFDTLRDLASVRDELERVLRPGGSVIHVLDLSTSPDSLFPELIAGGELPLTNFAGEPALLEVLTDAQKALLPPADEFDDVLAVKWEPFRDFVAMLEQARHPLAGELGPYASTNRPDYLDPQRLADSFMAASADPVRLLALNKALLKLTLSAKQMGRDWPLRAASSRAHIREKLRAAFGPEHGFAVEFAGPASACEVVPSDGTLPADVRFVLRHAGRTVRRPDVSPRDFGTPVEALEGVPTPPRVAGRDTILRETTVEVFAARRVGHSLRE